MKIRPGVCALLLALPLALFATFASRAETQTRPRWDYKVLTAVYPDDRFREAMLNSLGGEGWELTGVSDAHVSSANVTSTTLFFKRQK